MIRRNAYRRARGPQALAVAVALSGLAGGLVGCASDQRGDVAVRDAESVRSSLVLPGDAMAALSRSSASVVLGGASGGDRGWEFSRNDPPQESEAIPRYSEFLYLEQRHIEHLRTTSARPREHSSTTTRTIRRGLIVR